MKEKKIVMSVQNCLQFSKFVHSWDDFLKQKFCYLAEVKVVLERGKGIFHDVRKGIVSAVVDDLEFLLLALLEQ